MSSPLRDPKSISEWVELDYFRRPRRLRRARRALVWFTLLLGAGGLALALWPASHPVHPAGPVAPAHAMFGNDCRQCHTEFFRPAERLFRADEALRSVSDAACKRCHDGPPHH